MLRSLQSYIAKRKYHAAQRKFKRCSIYVFETHTIALPVVPIQVVWPDGPIEDHLLRLRDFDAVGRAVRAALDQSPTLVGANNSTAIEVGVIQFKTQMERIRAALNMGKDRFDRTANFITVVETKGGIAIEKQRPVRGYFAFEPSQDGGDICELPVRAPAHEIGRAVAEII